MFIPCASFVCSFADFYNKNILLFAKKLKNISKMYPSISIELNIFLQHNAFNSRRLLVTDVHFVLARVNLINMFYVKISIYANVLCMFGDHSRTFYTQDTHWKINIRL